VIRRQYGDCLLYWITSKRDTRIGLKGLRKTIESLGSTSVLKGSTESHDVSNISQDVSHFNIIP
jgi:hypothetical protein